MKKIKLLVLVAILIMACDNLSNLNPPENNGEAELLDVHGAGAQRSDPKTGDPDEYPEGHGPQGDVIRILNYVRPVRLSSSIADNYPVIDTNQVTFFDNSAETTAPLEGEAFYGQDANYTGLTISYTDNGDGTVTDNNTGLMWQQDPGNKMSVSEAKNNLESFELAGYSDWRLPTIKELYSLIIFSGRDISVDMDGDFTQKPFIDTNYFDFVYGDTSIGERAIDSQYLSSTKYVSTTMNGDETYFGVNFADGRIKGYPVKMGNSDKEFFVIYVRGNTDYGVNNFVDNGDGTITDLATGLMWLQDDSKEGMNWKNALSYAENLTAAGYSDWRLPDVKELQSILDYSRSLDTTNSAAIDEIFNCSTIIDEGGNVNYAFYWSSTTHADSQDIGRNAAYLAFGEALGFFSGFPGN